jgi:hypothetical protein
MRYRLPFEGSLRQVRVTLAFLPLAPSWSSAILRSQRPLMI